MKSDAGWQKAYEEYRSLKDKLDEYQIKELDYILECWRSGKPIDLPLGKLANIFVRVEEMGRIAFSIIEMLKNNDWRGVILSVVGEYGSGKSQLGLILNRLLEGEVESAYISLDPISDVEEKILNKIRGLPSDKPVVMIVDEIDQLLVDLAKGRRYRIEELVDLIRGFTQGGPGEFPRASFVLLLSKRAKGELYRDKALADRLLRRSSMEFRLSLSDDERVAAARDAVLKIMAVFASHSKANYSNIERHFRHIYRFLIRNAEEMALYSEIGTVIKRITETLMDVLIHMDEFAEVPSELEFGKVVEETWKDFMKKRLSAIPVTISIGESRTYYMATFSEKKIRAGQRFSDAYYEVWPYNPEKGERGTKLVSKIAVEIKSGRSWMKQSSQERSQLVEIAEHYPLIIFSIGDLTREELESIENQLSLPAKNQIAVIGVSEDLLSLSLLLKEDYRWQFIDTHGAFREDLVEVMRSFLKVTPETIKIMPVEEKEPLKLAISLLIDHMGRDIERRKYKRINSLQNNLLKSMAKTYKQVGSSAPPLSDEIFLEMLKVLEREGLGTVSRGRFNLSKESRERWVQLKADKKWKDSIIKAMAEAVLVKVRGKTG